VSSGLREIAKQRAIENGETGEKRQMVAAIRADEVEILSRSAIDKEALLRNMRLSRHAAVQASFARELAETEDARMLRNSRVCNIVTRVAVSASGIDEPRLARCVEAAREAANVEQSRLSSLSAKGMKDGTEWAKAAFNRDRGLWALQHEFQAALRETAETREQLTALWSKDAASVVRLAGQKSHVRSRAKRATELRKRDAQSQSYLQTIEASPWAAMTIQTPHGTAWARWPCEQYPVSLDTIGPP